MILVSMERRDLNLYYDTKYLQFGRVNFKIGAGNPPPRKTCYKKGSGRRGLNTKKILYVEKVFVVVVKLENLMMSEKFIAK